MEARVETHCRLDLRLRVLVYVSISHCVYFMLSLALDRRLLPSSSTPPSTRDTSSCNALDVSCPVAIRINIIEEPTSSNRPSSLRGKR